ncbi:unnamed protein product [Phytophthora fragariaefolia]|uniref:Unnamed protein product n=1 Tax=Phytophthora fragariaefolia TaxID=1490495 RepID=A0A9W7D6P7_9STRA|nr:unnamed protein product [Phytophthora fragariaefolia]
MSSSVAGVADSGTAIGLKGDIALIPVIAVTGATPPSEYDGEWFSTICTNLMVRGHSVVVMHHSDNSALAHLRTSRITTSMVLLAHGHRAVVKW